jgi:tetratricopeptide (TPR) repeat protein
MNILPLLITFFMGCPKQDGPPPADDPIATARYNFVQGVKLLQTPNRKTGEIDYQGAFDFFNQSAQVGQFAPAYYNAGFSAESLEQYDQAIQAYTKAVELDGNNKSYIVALVDALTEADRSAESIEPLKTYFAANPSDDIQKLLIHTYTEAKMHDEATAEIQNILRKTPESVEAYRLLSRNFFAKGEYDMSLLCAEKANEFAEGDASISNNMGVTYLVMKEEAAAIADFQQALEKEPGHIQANLNMGWLALDSGNYALARQSFEKIIEAHPDSYEAQLGLAVALRGQDEYKEAERIYTSLLKTSKEKIVFFNAATLQEKYVQNYDKALKLLEELKILYPTDTVIDERIARVKESQRIEAERKAEEDRKRKEAEEREKRQKEQFENLKSSISSLQSDVQALSSCDAAMEVVMEAEMYLEQGLMVVEMDDAEMAGDVAPFIEEAQNMINEVKPACSGGGSAPQEESQEETPEEETPAE